MIFEKLVVSLAIAKQLQAAGVKQESALYWGISEGGSPVVLLAEWRQEYQETYAAFTVGELGLLLPEYNYTSWDGNTWIGYNVGDESIPGCTAATEADARAKIILDHIVRSKYNG